MYFKEGKDMSLQFAMRVKSFLLLHFKVAGNQIKQLQQGYVINYSCHQ